MGDGEAPFRRDADGDRVCVKAGRQHRIRAARAVAPDENARRVQTARETAPQRLGDGLFQRELARKESRRVALPVVETWLGS